MFFSLCLVEICIAQWEKNYILYRKTIVKNKYIRNTNARSSSTHTYTHTPMLWGVHAKTERCRLSFAKIQSPLCFAVRTEFFCGQKWRIVQATHSETHSIVYERCMIYYPNASASLIFIWSVRANICRLPQILKSYYICYKDK